MNLLSEPGQSPLVSSGYGNHRHTVNMKKLRGQLDAVELLLTLTTPQTFLASQDGKDSLCWTPRTFLTGSISMCPHRILSRDTGSELTWKLNHWMRFPETEI